MQTKNLNSFIVNALAAIVVACSTLGTAKAQGDLLITPRRLVFDGKARTKEINLANTGKDTARYLISMMEIRMQKTGQFETITEPDSGQRFASKYVRFYPKSVVLAPNEAQTVKVQITKPNELQTGEYRSHIYIRGVANENALGTTEQKKDTNVIIHIVPQFGMSVPVIIRVGESTAEVSISDIKTVYPDDTTTVLDLIFNRTGNMSVYGDLKVEYVPESGPKKEVGMVNGISVYHPTPSRYIHLPLKNLPGVNYHKGKLDIVYMTPSEQKSLKMAEEVYTLH